MKYRVYFEARVDDSVTLSAIVTVFAVSASIASRIATQKMQDIIGPGKPPVGFKLIYTDSVCFERQN